VRATLEHKQALRLGAGKTEWNNVHVHDLSQLFVFLAEAAVGKNVSPELWGERGYFLAENGFHVWSKLSLIIAEAAKKAGYIHSTEVKQLSPDEAKEFAGFEALSWGLNSKGRALRARKFLGWSPKSPSLEEIVPDLVEDEAKHMGLSK
jgi:nucleoside-diphosphate-sugar epimerase